MDKEDNEKRVNFSEVDQDKVNFHLFFSPTSVNMFPKLSLQIICVTSCRRKSLRCMTKMMRKALRTKVT